MSTISLRLPDSLHETVRDLAEKEGISINQLIALSVAEKVSALYAEEYIAKRAKRGSRRKFLKALRNVSKRVPDPFDRL
jgi:hypothetical protein